MVGHGGMAVRVGWRHGARRDVTGGGSGCVVGGGKSRSTLLIGMSAGEKRRRH